MRRRSDTKPRSNATKGYGSEFGWLLFLDVSIQIICPLSGALRRQLSPRRAFLIHTRLICSIAKRLLTLASPWGEVANALASFDGEGARLFYGRFTFRPFFNAYSGLLHNTPRKNHRHPENNRILLTKPKEHRSNERCSFQSFNSALCILHSSLFTPSALRSYLLPPNDAQVDVVAIERDGCAAWGKR